MPEAKARDEDHSKSSQKLASIEPVKVTEAQSQPKISENLNNENQIENALTKEKSLITATQQLLRAHGIRKSAAAVRDAVEMPHEVFTAAQSVSALNTLGFKASFGNLKFQKISDEFYPLIAFDKEGEAIFLRTPPTNEEVEISKNNLSEKWSINELKDNLSGYLIIAKELSHSEKKDQAGHWFFSAFSSSKWLYAQVLIAAMVSNFLSLSTSFFTMTVYDRIIPNGAFESLLALSIGVVIALGFDFLIKSLRARFIDVASKKADLAISRRLFERILNLSPREQRQKTGALAGTIREFETLREFFNSSTVVIIIDLPFVFFFIYVIYLIAGPLAYVPLIAVPTVAVGSFDTAFPGKNCKFSISKWHE